MFAKDLMKVLNLLILTKKTVAVAEKVLEYNMPVTVDNWMVTIPANEFIKHDGLLFRTNPLERCLHELRHEFPKKKLHIEIPDGEPLEKSGFDQIIKKFVEKVQLPPESVIISMMDHYPVYKCDWATVELRPTRFFQSAIKYINVNECIVAPTAPLFGAVYGRATHSRLLMAHMLETEFPQDSYVIMQTNPQMLKMTNFEFDPVKNSFKEVLQWYATRQETKRDFTNDVGGNLNVEHILPKYHQMFKNYQIEVIIESSTTRQGWFTEKTTRCLISGKPFILYGAPRQLERLQQMGFQTFAGLINEEYDTIEDDEERFDRVQAAIRRVALIKSRHKFFKNLQAVAEHNKNNYQTITNKYYNQVK